MGVGMAVLRDSPKISRLEVGIVTEHEEQVALMRLVEMHKGRWPGVCYAI